MGHKWVIFTTPAVQSCRGELRLESRVLAARYASSKKKLRAFKFYSWCERPILVAAGDWHTLMDRRRTAAARCDALKLR